jgi:hypothetical protein
MISKLDGRVRKLEREARPKGLRAAIQGFVARDENKRRPGALDPNNPILQQGVDNDGEAVVSRWWAVTFFDGTREQQDERLMQLRADPRFQKPWEEGEDPICFEGGAIIENVIRRLSERKRAGLKRLTRLEKVAMGAKKAKPRGRILNSDRNRKGKDSEVASSD